MSIDDLDNIEERADGDAISDIAAELGMDDSEEVEMTIEAIEDSDEQGLMEGVAATPLRIPSPKQLYTILGDLYAEKFDDEIMFLGDQFIQTRFKLTDKRHKDFRPKAQPLGKKSEDYGWDSLTDRINQALKQRKGAETIEIAFFHDPRVYKPNDPTSTITYLDFGTVFHVPVRYFTEGSHGLQQSFSVEFGSTNLFLKDEKTQETDTFVQDKLKTIQAFGYIGHYHLAKEMIRKLSEVAGRPIEAEDSIPYMMLDAHCVKDKGRQLSARVFSLIDEDDLRDAEPYTPINDMWMKVRFSNDCTEIDMLDDIGLLRVFARESLDNSTDYQFTLQTNADSPELLPTAIRLSTRYQSGSLIIPWNGE